VGEAAKLKAFQLLGSLWNAHIALDQALLASTIEQQMQYAQKSGAKYVTIIGQREALDETAIVRNAATQLQETLPLDKMITKLSKAR
jgi:histidyl-tRNA synthetase